MRILFVCTGNTCRSPMAEGWARHVAGDRDIIVSSAGIGALGGEAASGGAVKAMGKRGVDISGHRARFVTDEILKESDLVLCMSAGHCEALEGRVEEGKLMPLLALAYGYDGPQASIVDPFMGSDEVYEAACREICAAVEAALEKIA